MSVFEKLLARIEIEPSGCWRWTGVTKANGYGSLTVDGKTHNAHRLVYETLVGPFPEGLVSDHTCRHRWCVNPDHVEPVTQRENLLRGDTLIAANAAKTTCPRGHEYDETTHAGNRGCSTCRKASMRKTNRRRRAAAKLAAAAALLLVLPVSASAESWIAPTRKITPRSITISWMPDRYLKRGEHYVVYFVTLSNREDCDSGGTVNPSLRVPYGRRARVFISADPVWCSGEALVSIDFHRPGKTRNLWRDVVRVPRS